MQKGLCKDLELSTDITPMSCYEKVKSKCLKVLTILYGGPESDEKKNAGVGTHGVAVAERGSAETFSGTSQLCCMSQFCSVCAGASALSLLYISAPSQDAPPTCAYGAAAACDPKGHPDTVTHSGNTCCPAAFLRHRCHLLSEAAQRPRSLPPAMM